VGTAAERAQALATLDELVEQGGDEASEAAFIRLAATLGGRHVPWSEAAEHFLMQHGYERAAIVAKCFYLTRWHAAYDDAEALLKPLGWRATYREPKKSLSVLRANSRRHAKSGRRRIDS
jgi:hypothetical protein